MQSDFLGQLVDLCTLANISLIIMDEPTHGYYIHGKAPWGKADIPLHVIQRKLQDEVNSEYGPGSRGLTKLDDRIQSFEIFMPKNLRDELHKVRTERPPDFLLERAAQHQNKRVVKVEDQVNDDEFNKDRQRDGSISAGWSEKEKNIRIKEYKK